MLALKVKTPQQKQISEQEYGYVYLTNTTTAESMALKHKEIEESSNQTFIWKQIGFWHLSEERMALLLCLHSEFRVCDIPQIEISTLQNRNQSRRT